MELRLLRAFVAVAEELHFGRAAARLHISQPPLSAAIQKLEDEVEARLFERTNRRVALTAAGEALLGRARHLLAEAERARDEVRRVARGETGVLSIGYTPTATYAVLPPLVRAFTAQHPGVRLELHEMASPAQADALREGRIEVGFVCLPVAQEGLRAHVLCREHPAVALPTGHPLTRRRRLAPGDLAREPFVGVRPTVEPGWALAFEAALGRHGVHPRIVQEVDTKLALLGLVAAGAGIAVVTRSLAAIRRAGVTFRPLEGLGLRPELGLLVRDETPPMRVAHFTALSRPAAASAASTSPTAGR